VPRQSPLVRFSILHEEHSKALVEWAKVEIRTVPSPDLSDIFLRGRYDQLYPGHVFQETNLSVFCYQSLAYSVVIVILDAGWWAALRMWRLEK